MLLPSNPLHRFIYGALALIAIIVIIQSFTEPVAPKPKPPTPVVPCRGEALLVDYPYDGGYLEPWACEIQCEDGIQRYILYSNGKASQCEEVPGCLDWGEDNGELCTPPAVSTL